MLAASLQQAEKGWFGYNAIVPESLSNSGCQVLQSSYSWSHTCNGPETRVLVIGVSMLSAADTTTVTGITYNGVAMTQVRRDRNSLMASELWYLIDPARGTNTVTVTLSGLVDSAAGAVSFIGVDQATPIDANNGATGSGDPATVAVTSITDNAYAMDTVVSSDTAITVGASQTQKWNLSCTLGTGAGSTEGPQVSAGAITMSWTDVGVANSWAISALALRLSGATPPSGVRVLNLMQTGLG